MKRYIVWNSNKTEGFITDDYSDAVSVFNGQFEGAYSALGYEFYERYGDDEMHLQVIDWRNPTRFEKVRQYDN